VIPISKRGGHLLGTIISETPSKSWAIVLYENKQSLYRPGSTISGWKVVEIKRREIILQRGKAKERLLIDETTATIPNGSYGARVVARSYIKSELQDLRKVARSIQIIPQTKGGRKGLHVQAIQSGSFLYNMGLREGDLLVTANGNPLTSFDDAASLMSILDKSGIFLEIIRKGKSQTLTFRLK
jgi:type II secretion system protein C